MHDRTLLDSLLNDIDSAKQLLELIDSEFDALRERHLNELESILATKKPLLASLGQHASARSQLLTSLNLSADKAGIEAIAARSTLGAELLESLDTLSALLERCQNGNLRNGRLIRANHATNKSLLGILRGGDAPSLYDSRGGAARIHQQRPLSQA